MSTVSLADAKAHLSELVERANNGEEICITRRGKPMARLSPIKVSKRRIDMTELRAVTDGMAAQPETAGDFMRRMRDDARY